MDIVAQMTNVIVPDLAKFENLKVEKSLELEFRIFFENG